MLPHFVESGYMQLRFKYLLAFQSASEILEYVAEFTNHSTQLLEKTKKRLREIDESLVIPVRDENIGNGFTAE